MHRFYLQSPAIKNKLITITDKRIVFQVGRVLRMRTGDHFSIFDEKQKEFIVKILEINRRQLLGNIIEVLKKCTAEPSVEVSLYQAIPKKTALFELIVQKATEIGVSHIYPLITKHTEKRRLTKFERLFSIAMEATEQCGRRKIPIIHHPVVFEEIVPTLTNGYLAYEYETKKYLADYKKNLLKNNELQILIGPEGGLSQKEIDIAKKGGVNLFTFGPRILRTETAAITALGIAMLNGR